MTRPRDAYKHTLDPIKGWMPKYNLTKVAKLSDEVTLDPVYEGRVTHLDSAGEFQMGCTGHQMPIFLLDDSDDPDVEAEAGDNDRPVIPSEKRMVGIPGIAGIEMATTEFDQDQDYAPNDLLRAVASNTLATGGRLTNQGIIKVASATPASATAVVGIVSGGLINGRVISGGIYQNSHKQSVLAFWCCWCPGATGA